MLLGTFTCTAVPGEFVWTPGLLTKVSSIGVCSSNFVLFVRSVPCYAFALFSMFVVNPQCA